MSSTIERASRALYDQVIAGEVAGRPNAGAKAEWHHLHTIAWYEGERAQRVAREAGVCSVCERAGFRPWQLDDSARCDECRP